LKTVKCGNVSFPALLVPALLCISTAAEAQEPSGVTADQGRPVLEEIVVTGSRIARGSSFDANTPVTTVSTDDLKASGTVNVESALAEMPQFVGSTLGGSQSNVVPGGQAFLNLVKNTTEGLKMRGFLQENPPSIVILNYRTEWMSDADKEFLRQRYVAIADDFMVLGSQLPAGGGTFEVFHAGRYRITSAEDSNIIGTYDAPKSLKEAVLQKKEEVPPLVGTIDGKPFDGKPVELSVGTHRVECTADRKAAVEWVGPHADSLPRLLGMNRHSLFQNWY